MEIKPRELESGYARGHAYVCTFQHTACWSPLKPAGMKPQRVGLEGICHFGTAAEKAGVAGQRQPAEGRREAKNSGVKGEFQCRDSDNSCRPLDPAGD